MKTPNRVRNTARQALALSVALAMVGADLRLAIGATDLSDTPLASSSTASVKPNILYILDDSGSMDRGYMPDEMGSNDGKTSYRNFNCNTIYYNPAITYTPPPMSADGTRFSNQSFTGALVNGYNSGAATKNLQNSFRADADQNGGGGNDNDQQAYYYIVSAGTVPTSPLHANCSNAPNRSNSNSHTVTQNGTTWKKVQVTSTSGPGFSDERTNFANWYSYYRTRLMMMKAATGRSFITLTGSYRVGFITINPGGTVSTAKYLRIQDFDYPHKQDFLDKLYQQTANNFTPLRRALSRAGWIFAGKLDTGITTGIPTADDPVQYSCQQNFALLTTDGYWNTDDGRDLSNVSLGTTDSDISVSPRPMHDGGWQSTRTTTTDVDTYFHTNAGCGSSSQRRVRYNRDRTTLTERLSGGVVVASSTSGPTTVATNQNYIGCNNPWPPLPSPNPAVTVNVSTGGGSGGGASNTLADVAQYYYQTDLRAGMTDNVPFAGSGVEDDRAPWQHMTTFTLGLGIFGTLNFHSDYKTNTNPASTFNQIRSGTIKWPDPGNGDPEKADDLWHTAVNGRGLAFSAANPDQVSAGLNATLAGVNARVASAAAAATSNLEPVAGDNFAYTASYETVNWVGDVQAREIDLGTGTVSTSTVWSAASKLLTKVSSACDTRDIRLFRAGATDNLVPFKLGTFTCDVSGNPIGSAVTTLNATEQAYFDASELSQLTQYVDMTDGSGGTVNQRTNAAGAALVNFLRGQRGNEGFVIGSATGFFRTRNHVLGDIVNAQPQFVRGPFANYADAGYAAFKSANASRTPMVYVASNDGLLHAFRAGTSTIDPLGGTEAWAFMPSTVLPNVFWLADNRYADLHKFYVDGTPVAADVYDTATSTWKTILVGGLNKGGAEYYALDITNPAAPKGLWELKHSSTCFDPGNSATWGADCNLGFSYGNPVISKLSDGTWAVFVTSGYNNVSGDANDGQGYLYVLNAMTGQIIKKIGTGVGDALNPSGLGKINNWVNDGLSNNTTERVYGVDLQGNIWRFDVNGAPASGGLATRLATTRDASSNPQPITTKPELANVGSPPRPMVYVATGRYLGASDIADTQGQTIYGIRDPLTATPYADLRASLSQIAITNQVVAGVQQRVAVCNSNCASSDGWFADLPDSGERVNVDMRLQLGTLTVPSNVPQNSACTIGGYSWINFFDYASGLPVATSPGGVVGQKLADSLAVGINIVRLPDGKTVVITTTSDAQQRTLEVPIASPAITGRRVSWREIGE